MISEEDQNGNGGFVDVNISSLEGDVGGTDGVAVGVGGENLKQESVIENHLVNNSNSVPTATATATTTEMKDDDFGLLDVEMTSSPAPKTSSSSIPTSTNHSDLTTPTPAPTPTPTFFTPTKPDVVVDTTHYNVMNHDNTATPPTFTNRGQAPTSQQPHQPPAQSLMATEENNHSNEIMDHTSPSLSPRSLTDGDLNIIQQLDEEYEKTLLEREIGWNARYISVRQNAGLSIWFMILFLTVGTIFFRYKTDWTLGESLLFSMYTITTVGYGRHEFPREPGVLFFISVYIFLGIATLTIMAAQLYQWVVLELTWARYEHDKQLNTKRHERNMQSVDDIERVSAEEEAAAAARRHGPMMDFTESGQVKTKKSCAASTLDFAVVVINKVQNFVKDYPYGQIIGKDVFVYVYAYAYIHIYITKTC